MRPVYTSAALNATHGSQIGILPLETIANICAVAMAAAQGKDAGEHLAKCCIATGHGSTDSVSILCGDLGLCMAQEVFPNDAQLAAARSAAAATGSRNILKMQRSRRDAIDPREPADRIK